MVLQSTNLFSGTTNRQNDIIQVCFPGVDTSDTIQSMGNAVGVADYTLLVSIIVSNLPNMDSRFWIEPDINGVPVLCTSKLINNTSGTNQLLGTFVAAGTVIAVPMVAVDFVGGRPTVHR